MNHLRTMDTCMGDAYDTGVLYIAGQNLRSYPIASDEEAPFNHKELLEIDISRNRFPDLPPLVFTCRALVTLNCYHNTLKAIPQDINKLVNLQHLNMRRNLITAIPMELCGMKQLCSLVISNNRLELLPGEIGRMASLQYLDVSNNYIREIPSTIDEMSSLKLLNIHNNHIKSLPDSICKLPLTDLIMSDNLIASLPTGLRTMKLLTTLQLDNNPIKCPPMQVCCRGRMHIFKFLARQEQRGSEPSRDEKSFAKGKNRRGNVPPHSHRSRPKSSISAMSDGTGSDNQKSVLADFETLVNSAFSTTGYKATGDKLLHIGEPIRHNGTLQSPERQKKPTKSSGHPVSPASSRRMALLGTLPRKAMKSPKEPHSQAVNIAPANSYDNLLDSQNTSTSTLTPPASVANSNRKLPLEQQLRPGSWNNKTSGSSYQPENSYFVTTVKPRARSNAIGKDDIPQQMNYAEDQLAPMRKNIKSEGELSLATSSQAKMASAATACQHKDYKVEVTTELEVKTPTAKNQPTTVPLDVDGVLSSLDFDLDNAMQQQQRELSPELCRSATPVPHGTTGYSAATTRTRSPVTLKKKSATIANSKDVELSFKESPLVAHRQSLPPTPAEAEWIDHMVTGRGQRVPVLQHLLSDRKPLDYTIKRQRRNIQAELEQMEDVKESIEMLLPEAQLDDIVLSFSKGVVLCQLVNRLFPHSILGIMDTEPMNMVKRTKNIDAFLEACTKLGVKPTCTAGDILDCKNLTKICQCIQTLLMKGGHFHSTV